MNNTPAVQANATGLTDNVAGALCYLFGLLSSIAFLVIAPYSTNRNVRFNAFQSLFLFGGMFASSIALSIVALVLPAMLGLVISMAYLAVMFVAFAAWVFLTWKTFQGSTIVLPIVGPLAQKYSAK